MSGSDFAGRLLSAARAAAIPLDAHAAELLARHFALMIRWNRRINLTRITDPGEAIAKHYLDSLLVCDLLPRGARVLDIGSGPGFPGIVCAAARPDLALVLSESSAKKRAFLSAAVRELDLAGVRVIARTSEVAADPAHGIVADRVVARAMGTLERIALAARPFLAPGGSILALKGPRAEAEIAESAGALAALGLAARACRTAHIPGTDSLRVIVELAPAA